MSEQKEFANLRWCYEDVQINAGANKVPREEAEEFLSSIEEQLMSYLAEMGNDFISSAWQERHPDWEFKHEEDDDEDDEEEEPTVEASSPATLVVRDSLRRMYAERDADGRLLLKGDGKFVLKSESEKVVIGKVVNGETVPLSAEDIEFCKSERLIEVSSPTPEPPEIEWENMDFGTEKEPKCGICHAPQEEEDAYYRDGELMEDVICSTCQEDWIYDSDIDSYRVRTDFEE